jgi:hypothetical protein
MTRCQAPGLHQVLGAVVQVHCAVAHKAVESPQRFRLHTIAAVNLPLWGSRVHSSCIHAQCSPHHRAGVLLPTFQTGLGRHLARLILCLEDQRDARDGLCRPRAHIGVRQLAELSPHISKAAVLDATR